MRNRASGRASFLLPPVFALRGGERAVRGSLREKIDEGAFAEVHAWAPGQVVKLFRS